MIPPYQDSIVVVTGASTGLGRAIAVGAAEQGAQVVVINYASSQAEAEETARRVVEAGVEPVLAQGDVGQDEDCRCVAAAAERFDRIEQCRQFEDRFLQGPRGARRRRIPADLPAQRGRPVPDGPGRTAAARPER
ncbi:MAG: SDR family NAD(P)-dependent oxidoreductase [Novosphingobium sp.]